MEYKIKLNKMPIQDLPLPPPPSKHEALLSFGRSQASQGTDLSGVTSDMNTLSRRLKLLEEGFTNMRRFFQITEESAIAKNKIYSSEIKTLTSDINEIRKELQEIKEKMVLIVRELQLVARKDEVKVLEKYINLWNPVKFVTQNEIEDIINEVLEKKQQ